MARKPRIHFEGALYHVICRGNNRDFIFKDDKWKEEYLEIVKRYKERYRFKMYAYVILDNHIHMLIEVDRVPLSKIMQGIQQVFTQRYNKTNKRTGHVFEQRYQSILCDKDEYLLMLIRYIHQNPVRIFDERGLSYPFSSFSEYIGKETYILDKEFPLSLFNNNLKSFMEFMEEKEEEIKKLKSHELAPIIERRDEMKGQAIDRVLTFEEAIENVAKFYKIEVDEVRLKTQKRTIVRARSAIIYLMENKKDMTMKEISDYLNISQSNVSVTLGNVNKREKMRKELEEIVKP